jgi:hypothetical protein
MQTNPFLQIVGLVVRKRRAKGNILSADADGGYTIATSEGATIRARPLPEQSWTVGQGVLVEDGRIVDTAPSLPGITQYV